MREVLEQEEQARHRRAEQQAAAEFAANRERQFLEDDARDRAKARAERARPFDTTPTRTIVIPKLLFYGSIAAAIGLAVMTVAWFASSGTMPEPTPAPATASRQYVRVATLVEQVDAQWEGASHRLDAGRAVYDEPVTLTQGYAKLRFENGAEVILQAPASIEPLAGNAMKLTQGRLVGLCVTPTSRGFTVQTPGARIVDIGTEFGVALTSTGETEAHVFDGEVHVSPLVAGRAAEPVALYGGEAGVLRRGGTMTHKPAEAMAFVRAEELDAKARSAASPYHRWLAYSYRLRRDPDLLAYYTFENQQHAPDRLLNRAPATAGTLDGELESAIQSGGGPTWASGRWREKGALVFDRKQQQRVLIPDGENVSLAGGFTVAAWFRLHSDDGHHLLVTQWDDDRLEGNKFIFHLAVEGPGNRYDNLGPRLVVQLPDAAQLIRPRAKDEHHDGTRTSIASGWGHVALTMTSDGTARLFKNGREIDTDSPLDLVPIPQEGPAWAIGHKSRNGQRKLANEFLDGLIDEVVVLRRAATPDLIREMYEAGKP